MSSSRVGTIITKFLNTARAQALFLFLNIPKTPARFVLCGQHWGNAPEQNGNKLANFKKRI